MLTKSHLLSSESYPVYDVEHTRVLQIFSMHHLCHIPVIGVSGLMYHKRNEEANKRKKKYNGQHS